MGSPVDATLVPDERLQRRLRTLDEQTYRLQVPEGGSGWVAPTLEGSCSNYGGGFSSAGYRRGADGEVRLRGLIKAGGTTAFVSTIFRLPEGFRPPSQELYVVRAAYNGAEQVAARVDVAATGYVVFGITVTEVNWLSLSGITFFTG